VEAIHDFRGVAAVVPIDPVVTGRVSLSPAYYELRDVFCGLFVWDGTSVLQIRIIHSSDTGPRKRKYNFYAIEQIQKERNDETW
jgi:hypothetical protein